MRYIDLHAHTTASDGTFTPRELVSYAAEKGLAAVALTDHDTVEGAAQSAELEAEFGVEVVPGIEISADHFGYGIHILGYFIDPASPAMARVLDWVIDERGRRNRRIIELMRADGVNVSAGALAERWPGAVIGRPHLAAALVENGLCASVQEGFDRFLSEGKKYYLPRTYLPLDTALECIRAAGGKAVFAHPLQYGMGEGGLLALTRRLVDAGCVGMECLYSGYSPEQSGYLRGIARRFGLCITGGSDFHGGRKPRIDLGSGTGELAVPYELLEKLRAR
ncbi:MAG: PHP domain-containing protein [Butyricicoccus sp.]|nr:PHP domain-containing protein [Butyricicoccus sp.]